MGHFAQETLTGQVSLQKGSSMSCQVLQKRSELLEFLKVTVFLGDSSYYNNMLCLITKGEYFLFLSQFFQGPKKKKKNTTVWVLLLQATSHTGAILVGKFCFPHGKYGLEFKSTCVPFRSSKHTAVGASLVIPSA